MLILINALLFAILFFLIVLGLQLYRIKTIMVGCITSNLQLWVKYHEDECASLKYIMEVTQFNSVAGRHALNALRPYIVSIQNNAIKREDYEEAQACKRMIKEMDEVIKKII